MNYITSLVAAGDESMPTLTLDGFCSVHGIKRVDLLKIDIQGNEPRALEGAAGLLRRGAIGTAFVELNWGKNASDPSPALECLALLDGAGFGVALPGEAGCARPGRGFIRATRSWPRASANPG